MRELSQLSDSCAQWRVRDPSVFAGVAGTAKELTRGVTDVLEGPHACPSCNAARMV